MDRTILDTEPKYDEAVLKVINEFGNGKKVVWEIKQHIIGTPSKIHSKIFVDAYGITLTPEELLKKEMLI